MHNVRAGRRIATALLVRRTIPQSPDPPVVKARAIPEP
jgi:hypothetical protein